MESDKSKIVKAGGKTYFFDVKPAKNGKPYLVITESRFQGEGKARERARITVFPEHAQDFRQAVDEMVDSLR